MAANCIETAEQLALELEFTRIIRRLVAKRLGTVALLTCALAAMHVVPWLAEYTVAAIWVAVVIAAVAMERVARERLMRTPVIQSIRQTDTRPTVR